MLSQSLRDTLTFLLGAGGFIHEVWWTQSDRPVVIAGCFALMGLPFVLNGRNGRSK